MDKPITGKQSFKLYKCKACGHEEKQQTNHWGQTYSCGHFNTCPKCPPYAKYPEFGGSTVWDCQEEPPEEFDKAPDWEQVTVVVAPKALKEKWEKEHEEAKQ